MREWKVLIPDLEPADSIVCDSYFSVVKSAEEGLGVALGIMPVINRAVNDKRLAFSMGQTFNLKQGYWMVAPQNLLSSEVLSGFFEWTKDLFELLPHLYPR